MTKKNNPGCGCCEPPCLTDCGDGTSDEIAEWEWSIADLTNEVYAYLRLDKVVGPFVQYYWYKIKITGFGDPPNQGLAELNGIYILSQDLVTCQTPTIFDSTPIKVQITESQSSYVVDFCPTYDAYSPIVFDGEWGATAYADRDIWGIQFNSFSTKPASIEYRLERALNNIWGEQMFDSRIAYGGDGPCVSKTYQSQPPWVPDSCTVDETRQTFNNVYTVTPA